MSVFKPTADFEQTTHFDQLFAVLSVSIGLVCSSQTVYSVKNNILGQNIAVKRN